MKGLMQDWPLVVPSVLDHAAREHGEQTVVTRGVEGDLRRATYRALRQRALRVAKALERDGIAFGDRVATMAWNTDRHLEVWYGVMGLGAICHTLNPRLFADQLVYIVEHAEDRVLFIDATFLPVLEAIRDRLPSLERIIVLTDAAHLPETALEVVAYEDWLAGVDDDFAWKRFDEDTAAGLCYTSGTTGHPKGVLYSHRSNVLHTLAVNQADVLGVRARDVVLPVVPMFHANAWGLVFAVPAAGGRLVMPGARLDGEGVYELLDRERVSVTAAVPTVWLMLLAHLDATGATLPHLERLVIGGAACPRMMIERFEQDFDVAVSHAWGMTEMSPLGTLNAPKPGDAARQGSARIDHLTKQGRAPYTVEMKIVDDEGRELPRDGEAFGHLLVRGPAVARAYFRRDDEPLLDDAGWMPTGDVATIDAGGAMQITDRSKDVIKSGGEWISSIEIENLAVGHPDVAEAAVIGIAHPKWNERPLLVVVPRSGTEPTRDAVLAFLEGKIASWWMPDDVAFVDAIPHTATGKVQKRTLRERFAGHRLSGG